MSAVLEADRHPDGDITPARRRRRRVVASAPQANAHSAPSVWRVARTAVLLLLPLVLVYEFWVTGVVETRNQVRLLTELKHELSSPPAGALGAPPKLGSPVALVEIPRLGVEKVVIEGTSADRLAAGPGHVRGTALPGTTGESVILGRASTSGSPFSGLADLRVGDDILVTGALGKFEYVVRDAHQAPGAAELALVTSTGGWLSDGTLTVHATLDGEPALPANPGATALAPSMSAAASVGWFQDGWAWLGVAAWGAVLAAALWVAWLAYRRTSPWLSYLLSTPVIVALLFLLLEASSRLLPVTR